MLPDDAIWELGLRLDLRSLYRLRLANRRANSIFNDRFWHYRFMRDFTESLLRINHDSWLERYKHEMPGELWASGSLSSDLKETVVPVNLGIKARDVSVGREHVAFIDPEGKVWTFGDNKYGQLGHEFEKERFIPTPVGVIRCSAAKIPTRAKAIATGLNHTVVLDENNDVWTFGENHLGQLGNKCINYSRQVTPVRIPNLKAKAISAGWFHTLIIDLEGMIWGFGTNASREIGLAHRLAICASPVQIPNLPRAKAIVGGGFHSLAIDLDGNIWVFGSNKVGQLGQGFNDGPFQPVKVHGLKAQAISTNEDSTLILDSEGAIWSSGGNLYGNLGLGATSTILQFTRIPRVKGVDVSTDGDHSLILTPEGTVLSFGSNIHGQLGLGYLEEAQYGRIFNFRDRPTQISTLPPVKKIVAGNTSSFFILR